MSNLNKCMFIGRLGKDPEIRIVSETFKTASFSIAITEKWTDKPTGEKKESTEWVNCKVTNKLADICEKWVKKGDLLYIEGKLKTQTWEKEGVKQYNTFIQVENISMFPKAKEAEPLPTYESPVKGTGLPPTEYATHEQQPGTDDLPF